MRLIGTVIIFVIFISFIIYSIIIKKTESIGPYELKKVNLFERIFLYPSAYFTDDDYIIYYNNNLIKWADTWKTPSTITKRFNEHNPKLSELDFKEYRNAKMYFDKHPYSYRPYMDFSNDIYIIKPDNYTIIDRYVIQSRNELISKIEHMNYLLTDLISFTNSTYDNMSRTELLKMIESLSEKVKKSKKVDEDENK